MDYQNDGQTNYDRNYDGREHVRPGSRRRARERAIRQKFIIKVYMGVLIIFAVIWTFALLIAKDRTEPVMSEKSSEGSVWGNFSSNPAAGQSGYIIEHKPYINDSEDSQALKNQYKSIVYLDPGHGGIDDGASRNGIKEQDINLAVAMLVKDMIEENCPEILPVISRGSEEKPDNLDRAAQASSMADILVSIHCNTYGEEGIDNEVKGTEVHFSPNQILSDNRRTDFKTSELAVLMLSSVCESSGSNSRGLVDNSDLVVTSSATIPSILIEMGFISNADERQKLNSPEYKKLLAQGIFNGIVKAFGMEEA